MSKTVYFKRDEKNLKLVEVKSSGNKYIKSLKKVKDSYWGKIDDSITS